MTQQEVNEHSAKLSVVINIRMMHNICTKGDELDIENLMKQPVEKLRELQDKYIPYYNKWIQRIGE